MRDTYSEITRQATLQRGAVATGRLTLESVASSGTAATDIGEGRVLDVHPNTLEDDSRSAAVRRDDGN